MSSIRYDNEASPVTENPLRLLYIASSRYDGEWHSSLHSHQFTELFYVVGGKGQFLVENLRFPVSGGDVVIINPNVQHTETALDSHPLEYIVLGMEGGEFLLEGSEDTRYCSFSCDASCESILALLREILKELEEKQERHGALVRNLLENLSIKLLRRRSLTLAQQSTVEKSSLECSQVKHYIDNHFKEPLTLDGLSKVAHLNKYYLSHAFRKEMGISPINYLIYRRIAESKHMLTHTRHSISEIAQILGFSSPSYFSQSFSRLNQISPRDYRARHRLEKEA